MSPAAEPDSLETLASEIQAVTPGFAARLRDASARLKPALPSALLDAYGGALRRAIAVEGAGREASQALLQLSADDVAATGEAGLGAWSAAVETVGAHSVRAASALAAAALGVLPGSATAVSAALAPSAEAVARLARRHGGDPIGCMNGAIEIFLGELGIIEGITGNPDESTTGEQLLDQLVTLFTDGGFEFVLF